MKVWISDDFEGFWPVGTSAVIVADTEERALELLAKEMEEHALKPDQSATVREIDTTKEAAIIIDDGSY